MTSQIYNFYYLDDSGIDRLFAQSGKPYVEQVIHKKLKGTKGVGKTKFGLGSLFQWLGLGKAEVEGELSHEKVGSEEFSEIFRVEHKAKIVLDSLKEEKRLISLTKDNFDPTAIQKSKFVELEGAFKTPALFHEQMSLEAFYRGVQKSSFVEFECRMGKSLILMRTSLGKYKLGLIHLKIAWSSRKVGLRVFGELTRIKENEFYLKPFSIRPA